MDNRTALSPKADGTPELDARVDRLFASAMEHQLEEQRTLSRLASRVENALRELQRGIDSLSQYVSAAAAQSCADTGGDGADPVVLEKLTRLAEDTLRQRVEVREGLGRLADQLDVAGLRSEIAELAARIEQRTTALPGAMSEMRGALSDLAARVERGAQPQTALASLLTSLLERLEALSGDQDEAARLLGSAQRTLSEQAVRLETLREAVQAQAGHAGDRVAALLDHATANQRELLAELGGAATRLAAEASFARDAVRLESEQLRDALAEAIASARTGLDQAVSAARTVSDQAVASGGASRDAVDRMQSLVEALVARLQEAQAQGGRRLAQAASVLEQAAQGLEPAVLASVEDLRQVMLDTAAAANAQSESTVAALRGVAAGTVDELRGLVEDVAQRMLDAQAGGTAELTEAATNLVRAADDLQPTFSSALAKLYGAVAAAATQVRATSEEAAARTETTLTESLRSIETVISDRLSESGVAAQAAVTRLGRAAETLAEQGAALRPALADAAEELRRSLLEASAEDRVRADVSLHAVQRAAEGAAGEVEAAVSAALDRLSAVVCEVADRAAEQQSADTTVLADAADHVARTAESLAPAVAAALARVDGTVAQAVTLVETALGERLAQSDAAAQIAAGELAAAASDAQDRLRVWLAGTLPDAVARMTADLGEQLGRVEARVDETVARMEAVWGEAGGGLRTAADAAGTRMAEAARALTAVAGSNVDGAERRLQMITEKVDALVLRLDGVTDSEGRRADATEEILALLRGADGGLPADLPKAPGQLAPMPATGGVVDLSPQAEAALALVTKRFEAVLAEIQSLRAGAGDASPAVARPYQPSPRRSSDADTVVIQLEDTLGRAEDLEHRLSERIEEAALRLDEACGSLVRLESQLVAYLRERDRMGFEEREQLIADLTERLGSAAVRKDGSRLLGGLLQGSGRRRDPEPPVSPPARPLPARSPQQAVRPTGQTPAGGLPRDNQLLPDDAAQQRRGTQHLASCEVCGFVARSPGGLAAHRRTHD
ncbi:MAG: hypothetical protein ACRD0K_17255 [Egibacteraceae bacterium]